MEKHTRNTDNSSKQPFLKKQPYVKKMCWYNVQKRLGVNGDPNDIRRIQNTAVVINQSLYARRQHMQKHNKMLRQ